MSCSSNHGAIAVRSSGSSVSNSGIPTRSSTVAARIAADSSRGAAAVPAWSPDRHHRPCDTRRVDEDDLRKLEAAGSALSFGAGQMLIESGKPGTGLYVLLDGQIVVEAPEGTRELGPGAVVGERALFSEDGTRTARVRALTHGVVVAVDRAGAARLCPEDPGSAEPLAAVS